MPKTREIRIFCPKCRWVPRPHDSWMCGCSCTWNTFETAGVCPDCGKAHAKTQCLACWRWSAHGDWYHEFGGGERKVEEEVVELEPATAGS